MSHAYEVAQEQFVELVRAADRTTVVPACPDWTVHELLAHQVHQLAGALDGSFPVADALDRLSATDGSTRLTAEQRQEEWIRRGVAEWSAHSTSDLLHSWSELTNDAPAELLDALVPDVVVHLFDLEGAVGSSAARDDRLVTTALQFWSSIAGVPMPNTAHDRFETLRVITGRRSRAQAPDVSDDVALYGWRDADLEE